MLTLCLETTARHHHQCHWRCLSVTLHEWELPFVSIMWLGTALQWQSVSGNSLSVTLRDSSGVSKPCLTCTCPESQAIITASSRCSVILVTSALTYMVASLCHALLAAILHNTIVNLHQGRKARLPWRSTSHSLQYECCNHEYHHCDCHHVICYMAVV